MLRSTTTLTVGDHAPPFTLSDTNGDLFALKSVAGKPTVLFFYASDKIEACREIAGNFRNLMPALNDFDVQVYGISPDAPEERKIFAKEDRIPFVLLSDLHKTVSKKYGVCFTHDREADVTIYNRFAFLLDSNQRIVKIYHLNNVSTWAIELLADLKALPREEPRHIRMQAPVLLIPNVFSLELCRELIDIWHTKGNDDSGFMGSVGEKTVLFIDYQTKIRRDHFVYDRQLQATLNKIIMARIAPEIEKAFHYQITRQERYRIACYDGSLGAFFRPHRDNTTGGTAHRRFAMSLNLNVGEYEGGYLRFPEYGPHLYKPDTGSAIIFSGSLTHEATPVTSGIRFVLLNFFYGDEEAQSRKSYEERVKNDYDTAVRINS
ncbi:MAG: redoxin domain-containing protein [Okeania sp. SIO2H7]|nr:redoxin domain-containing protein [Okeania sp. SIO2H7]